jgi:hypothetical protein
MATTNRTHVASAKKSVFPIRPLFSLVKQFHLLVIDGEAFLIKGKDHKQVRIATGECLDSPVAIPSDGTR